MPWLTSYEERGDMGKSISLFSGVKRSGVQISPARPYSLQVMTGPRWVVMTSKFCSTAYAFHTALTRAPSRPLSTVQVDGPTTESI